VSDSPSTTSDVGTCEADCGRPRASVGREPFHYVFPLCEECMATRASVSTAEESARHIREQEERIRACVYRLEQDVGLRFAGYRLSTYPDGGHPGRWQAASDVETWVGSPRENLILHGPVGEGKTGLAVGAAFDLAGRGIGARFIVGRDWLDEIRRSSSTRDTDRSVEEDALRAPVLVLDDLGTERTTPFALERLLSLIDHRYRHLRPTIVTSNLSPSGIAAALGETDETIGQRIVSRLVENAVRVELSFGDLRVPQAERAA
jgi:DNA replication protein DnaC